MAARLLYLAEGGGLLPRNQSGVQPKRSAEQALNIVVDKIYEARRQAVSLVAGIAL